MSRLPAQLQPLWPAAKVLHRHAAHAAGVVGRAWPGEGPVPSRASPTSAETARREPDAVRRHVAGAGYDLARERPEGEPSGHWWFETVLDDHVPERFVLELDDGSAVGPHVAVVTRDGTLDVETSHYFGIRGWREHPVFLELRSQVDEVDGTVLVLAARATGANYYHFLIDALPRLGILAASSLEARPDAYLVDSATRYQRELLALLGLEGERLIAPRRGRTVRADRLLVPSLPNVSTLVSPETTRWLADRLPPRAASSGLPQRLYVTRGTTPHTRCVVEEDEVVRRLTRRGFAVIDPGTLSVQEQIDHFAAARVVVAPHGAALTNLVFCRPGVRVLEMFAPTYLNGGYFSIVSGIEGSRYRYLVADRPRPPAPGSTMSSGLMHDVAVRPQDVDDQLDALLEGAA